VYDVFTRSFKRFRVVITIDSRLSAKKKFRVDAQKRVSFEIAFDSKSEMKRKKLKKEKKNTKEEKNERNEEERKKNENDEIDNDDERNDNVDV
jgi:uncharacterized membrane protein YdbT with pleckstrin-like domain